MIMQGIYINKDSFCAFFKERKLKKKPVKNTADFWRFL